MKKITFTKLLAADRPPIEVENWPGYRTGLSNLPGINLVLAHRTNKQHGGGVGSLSTWGVYDEESGFYLGIHGPIRTACYANAICKFTDYTLETYAAMIEARHVKRITTILTEGMQ